MATEQEKLTRSLPVSIGDIQSIATEPFMAQQSIEVGVAREGETAPRRNALWPELTTDIPGFEAQTTFELFNEAAERFPDRRFFGVREKNADGTLGDYVWETFREIHDRRDHLIAGYAKMGLSPSHGDLFGVFSRNRPEWHLTEFVCHALGAGTVGVYPTLGPDAVGFITKNSGIKFIGCEGGHLELVLALVQDPEVTELKTVVAFDPVTDEQVEAFKAAGATLVTFAELEAEGSKEGAKPEFSPPSPDDIWALLYTSGSTGVPKGAIMHQRHIVAQVGSVARHDAAAIEEDDCVLSYLPFVHSLDKVVFYSCMSGGARVGFYGGDMTKLVEDMSLLGPITLVGTPRVFDKMRDKFTAAMVGGGFIKSLLWSWGYPAKQAAVREGRATPWWDAILFNKLKARLGGVVKRFISAAAPLDPTMGEFIAICFNCATVQGYGATENLGPATMTYLPDWHNLTVGPPVSTHEVKLVDALGFSTSSTPPRGEVVLRGTGVFVGYYNNEELTASSIDDDGWYHTGDVGEWDEHGCLRIVDRVKSIFKLTQGEYVASEYVEVVISRSRYVAQAFVDAPAISSFVLAVIVPDLDACIPLSRSLVSGHKPTMEDICENEEIKATILRDIHQVARDGGLNSFEIPRDIILEPVTFSVENDLLTPTFKLRRANARDKYREAIAALGAEVEA